MPTLLHLLLALALTLFLAYQARSLAVILRHDRAPGRLRAPLDLLWTSIPVLVVLFLAARSWVAVFDVERPAVASSVTAAAPSEDAPRAAPSSVR